MKGNRIKSYISIFAIIGVFIYFWLIFLTPWDYLVVKITVFLGVSILFLLIGWIWSPFLSRAKK